MESQTVARPPAGPHPHEHHLVPHHWTHASSLSPFSNQQEYSASTETNNYPLVPPTRAEYLAGGKRYRWTARAHRKGVPPRLLREKDDRELGGFAALVEREGKQWWNLVWKIRWWGWDFGYISWWVAFLFTLGSVFWCIQGIQVFCYPNNTTTVFTNTEAVIAFLGGTTFLIGGYLGYVESLNPAFADWDGAFAYEVEEVLGGKRELPAKASRASSPSKTHLENSSPPLPRWLPPPSRSPSTSTDHAIQSHHPPTLGKRRRHFGAHAPPPPPPPPQAPTGLNKKASSLTRPPSGSSAASAQTTLLLSPSSSPSTSATRPTLTPSQTPAACCRSSRPPKWKWFGLPPAHKRLDLGFLANAIQLFGAVAFEVSVICGLPGVLGKSGAVGGVEQEGRVEREWIAAYWAMQILGSPCFTFAGLVFALETQTRWYKPNLVSIGWWIGIWNTNISNPEHYQRWGTAFSTFWGSWAFLIGSYIQMLETLNKWT
nr:endo-polygalacturonase PG1 [Rhodotorula mucilaginosa]